MPSIHYVPPIERFQKQSKTNKQGSGEVFTEEQATLLRNKLQYEQGGVYGTYKDLLDKGLAKEVARVNTPVSRYSKMRAKTDLRNWLAFLSLRMEMSAQWEIRQYANAVASMVNVLFPKTFQLFIEHDFMGERFSRSEMKVLRSLLGHISSWDKAAYADMDLSEKAIKSFVKKLSTNKENVYEQVLDSLGVK